MDFIVPYDQIGVSPPGPWQNASPAAGTKGSIVNALVFPAVQTEIINVITAAGLTPDGTTFTQLLAAIKLLIPEYAPAAPAAPHATANGGLAVDNSGNFFLSLIANLLADTRNAPVDADSIPLGRAADGAMIRVPASKLATYIISNIVSTNTFQQVAVNPILYVRTDGNDANDGLANTAGRAFATIGAALAKGTSAYNFASSQLTIQLGIPGTYVAPANPYLPVGSGAILVQGDPANKSGYVITGPGTAGSAIMIAQGFYNFTGLTIQNTGTSAHTLAIFGSSILQNVSLICTTSGNGGAHIFGGGTGTTIGTGCDATGGMGSLFWASGGKISINPSTAFAILGSPTFSIATLYMTSLGQFTLLGGASVTQAGTVTGKRYLVSGNSVATMNGAGVNAIPGTIAGTTDSGGQYGS